MTPNSSRAAVAISGQVGITAVFGDPVKHSMSPAMHNAAYAALAMDRVYLAFHVTSQNFATAMRAIPALGILGVNLTVPHKEAAARMLKNLSAEAKLLRAVNCVINERGKLRGDNTDAHGLEADLRALGVGVKSQLAIVIGAGGAAAAAILACARMGATRIAIANRTRARATNLAKRFRSSRIELKAYGLDALTDASLLADAALLLNATSMGLTTGSFAPLDYAATPSKCFFYDAIYRAEPTPFLREAIALGRPRADGAGMLINQGELAFELFNGVAPPAGVMGRVLLQRLGRT
ncbi:MAG TPA: shikimate dehydrogenase [Candidatus Binataceae bacterium]|nr:shikimate dehydrogenase [Candidatus Binataceae bacterium]